MEDNTIKIIAAMACITVLETVNMILNGGDGIVLSTIVSIIAGLAGYTIAKKIESRKKDQ